MATPLANRMASGLTINVSAVSAGLVQANAAQAAASRAAQTVPSAAQVAQASQAATERVASIQKTKEDSPVIRIPKRVEPGYGPKKNKKKAGAKANEEEKEAAPREETLDLKA